MSELKDCPLQFHDFKSVDHLKVCPRYTAVLARSEDDGIGIEELDTLQLELETLLSSASRRLRVLEAETQVMAHRGLLVGSGPGCRVRPRVREPYARLMGREMPLPCCRSSQTGRIRKVTGDS